MFRNNISQDFIFNDITRNSIAINYLLLGKFKNGFFKKKFVFSSIGIQFLNYVIKNYANYKIYIVVNSKFEGKLNFIKDIYNFLNIEIYYFDNDADELRLLYILDPSIYFITPQNKVKYKNYIIVDSLFEF